MNYMYLLIAFFAGIGLGSLLVWLLLRAKLGRLVSEAKAEVQAQVATLIERVSAREQEIAGLRSALAAEEDQKTQLAMQLQQESNAKAAAEERSNQLEQQLKGRLDQVKEVEAGLAAERETLAGVTRDLAAANAQLEAERKANGKLAQERQIGGEQLDRLQGEFL